jgi:hypothetical protein
MSIGMKMKQKWMKLLPQLFTYFFTYMEMDIETSETSTKIDTAGNKYGTKYSTDTDGKRMITGTTNQFNDTQATQVNQQTFSPTLSKFLSVMGSRGCGSV